MSAESNSEQTLKPCPWCPPDQSAPTPREQEINRHVLHGPIVRHWIECDECNCRGPYEQTAELAASAWNSRASANVVAPTVGQRRLEIALRYIKRAANRELPKLPCRVDEMTEREVAIFNVGAAAVGNLQFIARELDALPAASPVAPVAQSDKDPRCDVCGTVLVLTLDQRTTWQQYACPESGKGNKLGHTIIPVSYKQPPAAAPSAARQDEAVCLWTLDPETGYWRSACGTNYFNEDDPPAIHAGAMFCHRCGKRIEKAQ